MRVNIQTFGVNIDHFYETLLIFNLLIDFFIFLIIHYSAILALPYKFILVVKNSLYHFVKAKLLGKKNPFKLLLRKQTISKLPVVSMTESNS